MDYFQANGMISYVLKIIMYPILQIQDLHQPVIIPTHTIHLLRIIVIIGLLIIKEIRAGKGTKIIKEIKVQLHGEE